MSYGECDCMDDPMNAIKLVYFAKKVAANVIIYDADDPELIYCEFEGVRQGDELPCDLGELSFSNYTLVDIMTEDKYWCIAEFDTSCLGESAVNSIDNECPYVVLTEYAHRNGICEDGYEPCDPCSTPQLPQLEAPVQARMCIIVYIICFLYILCAASLCLELV